MREASAGASRKPLRFELTRSSCGGRPSSSSRLTPCATRPRRSPPSSLSRCSRSSSISFGSACAAHRTPRSRPQSTRAPASPAIEPGYQREIPRATLQQAHGRFVHGSLCSTHVRRHDAGQGGQEAHAVARAAEPRAGEARGKQKATAVGIAGGLGAVAVVLLVYAIGFAFAAIAAGLSEALSLWLSLLIVAAILLLVAAIVGFLAVRFARKASPPTPSQALEEAARTVETLQSHV